MPKLGMEPIQRALLKATIDEISAVGVAIWM
jgi:hypothetical protein